MYFSLILFSFLITTGAQYSTTPQASTTKAPPPPEISTLCVECMSRLQPLAGCRKRGGVEYCGPFQLTKYFFMDCYDLGLKYPGITKNDFQACGIDMNCAEQCVRVYHNYYAPQCLKDKRRKDGNRTQDLVCADYGRIHNGGPFSCGNDDSATTIDFLYNMTDTCGCMNVYGTPSCPTRPPPPVTEADEPLNETMIVNSTSPNRPKYILADVVPRTSLHIQDDCLSCLTKLNPSGCETKDGILFCGPLGLSEGFYKDCTFNATIWQPPVGKRTFRRCAMDLPCAKSCLYQYHSKYSQTCLDALQFNDARVNGFTCADFGRIHAGGPYSCGSADSENVKKFITNMTLECGCDVVHGRPCTYVAPKELPTTAAPKLNTTEAAAAAKEESQALAQRVKRWLNIIF